MPRKKKTRTVEQYAFLTIRLERFSAAVDAAINYQAEDPRWQDDDTRVYRFDSRLELQGVCTYPEDRVHEIYQVTVYGEQAGEGKLDDKLRQYCVTDTNGGPRYRKVRGRHVPVYSVPSGIGLLHKVRGLRRWDGAIWVPEHTLAQMLALLNSVEPLYMETHEHKVDRTRWIRGFTLQTEEPDQE